MAATVPAVIRAQIPRVACPLVLSADRDRRFRQALAVIVLLGAVLRIAYVLTVTRYDDDLYDATWYEMVASSIAHGDGFFEDPFEPGGGPGADHPPLTVLLLVPAGFLEEGGHGAVLMRLTMVAIGCGTIVLVGLLGRKVGGAGVGLLAAGLAAVDPNLWMNDGLLMSESIATALVTALVLAVFTTLDGGPTPRRAILLGLLAGAITLARGELVILAAALVLGALVSAASRWRLLATAAMTMMLVMAPWVTFNLVRFEEPTTISTNLGLALRAGNCPSTYHGELLGWAQVYPFCTPARAGREQSVWDAAIRREGLAYMRDNLDRLPVVVAARVGRLWNVYRVEQSVELTSKEGRPTWAGWSGAVATWLLVPVAVFGAVQLRRRGQRIWPLVVPIVATTAVAAGLSGVPRYRAPSEPALLVLAAAGAIALTHRARARSQ